MYFLEGSGALAQREAGSTVPEACSKAMKKTDRSFASLIFIRLRRTVFPSLALADAPLFRESTVPEFFPPKNKPGPPLRLFFLKKQPGMFWTH